MLNQFGRSNYAQSQHATRCHAKSRCLHYRVSYTMGHDDPMTQCWLSSCTTDGAVQGKTSPSGADAFADDSKLYTDGPDAMTAMAAMAPPAVGYLRWAGMEIHLKKCGITAMDMRTGQHGRQPCVGLPRDISQITTHCLQQQCILQGCYALNQLQLLLRIRGNAETALERFLLRLDGQGLEISSPWESGPEPCLLERS